MKKKNVTIKDIARLSGVSEGTVDRVIHNRGRVGEESLKKVLKVLEEFEYKPNLIARTLGSNKNYRIATLIPHPNQDAYWAQVQHGISQAGNEWAQYSLSIESFFFNLHDTASFEMVGNSLLNAQPDAILIAPIYYQEALSFFKTLHDKGIPYILFNTNIKEAKPISFIGQNLYASGAVAAELMLLGQNEPGTFAVLHINEDIHNSVHLLEKERGFREYLIKKNHFSRTVSTYNMGDLTESIYQKQLDELISDPQLKGIFVSTSTSTYKVAAHLEAQKKAIRLIGYDLLEENLHYLKLGFVNFLINQNPKGQALLGISHLANLLLFKKNPPPLSFFPLEIITQQNLDSYLESIIH